MFIMFNQAEITNNISNINFWIKQLRTHFKRSFKPNLLNTEYMETVNWNISRMHYDGFSARPQKVISGKDGVQSATVSYAEKQASLEKGSAKISQEQLQDTIEKAGFEITFSWKKGILDLVSAFGISKTNDAFWSNSELLRRGFCTRDVPESGTLFGKLLPMAKPERWRTKPAFQSCQPLA